MRILVGRNHAMINRAAFAQVPTFTPTNTGEIALYNNSSGPHVLVVWDFTLQGASISHGFAILRKVLTTRVGPGQSVVAGEPAPIGLAYKDDLVTPDAYQAEVFWNSAPMNNTTPMPLAVLLPGWSFVVPTETAAATAGGTFWYQWLYAQEYGYNARNPEYEIQ